VGATEPWCLEIEMAVEAPAIRQVGKGNAGSQKLRASDESVCGRNQLKNHITLINAGRVKTFSQSTQIRITGNDRTPISAECNPLSSVFPDFLWAEFGPILKKRLHYLAKIHRGIVSFF